MPTRASSLDGRIVTAHPPAAAAAVAVAQPDLARRAMQPGWSEPVLFHPDGWTLPAGATGDVAGPI